MLLACRRRPRRRVPVADRPEWEGTYGRARKAHAPRHCSAIRRAPNRTNNPSSRPVSLARYSDARWVRAGRFPSGKRSWLSSPVVSRARPGKAPSVVSGSGFARPIRLGRVPWLLLLPYDPTFPAVFPRFHLRPVRVRREGPGRATSGPPEEPRRLHRRSSGLSICVHCAILPPRLDTRSEPLQISASPRRWRMARCGSATARCWSPTCGSRRGNLPGEKTEALGRLHKAPTTTAKKNYIGRTERVHYGLILTTCIRRRRGSLGCEGRALC